MAIRYLTVIATTALLATAAHAQNSSTSSSSTSSTSPSTSTMGTTAAPAPGSPPPVNSTATGTDASGTDMSNSSGMSGTGTTGTSGTNTTGTMNGTSTGATNGTLGGSSASTAAGTTLHGQDATFLQKAAQAGREEVADAQLALQNAQRSETKSVAQMMMDDHRRSNDQLQQLASRKGWTWPTGGSAESDQSRDLASGGKSDFDQRYITEEIRDHRDAIAAFRTEESSGSDPDLRQFARDNLPALEHHLEMLQGANSQK